MRILVTGGTGFIGRNLIEKLNSEGYCVYKYHRNQPPDIIKEVNPQIIFHLAAEIYDTTKMFDSNIKLTYDLLEQSKEINYQTFIYVGSSSEYGRKTLPSKETDVLVPDNLYEATKGAGTLLCQAYGINKPVIVARPFSVYGRYEASHRFIPTIYNCYKTQTPLHLSEGVHDWIDIDDFISSLMHLAFLKDVKRTIVNIGTGIQTSNSDVVKAFEDIIGRKIEITHSDKLRSFDSNCWVADTTYAEKLGVSCQYTLRQGIEKYIKERDAGNIL